MSKLGVRTGLPGQPHPLFTIGRFAHDLQRRTTESSSTINTRKRCVTPASSGGPITLYEFHASRGGMSWHGDADSDGRSLAWPALDLKLAAARFGALAHGLQPEVARVRLGGIKAFAIIGNFHR